MQLHLIFNISSAEQSKKLHSRDKVANVGCILPEQYCDAVGSTATTVNLYGCGYVEIASALQSDINAVYKQIYFFNSGSVKNGETDVTDHENTNLTVYSTAD